MKKDEEKKFLKKPTRIDPDTQKQLLDFLDAMKDAGAIPELAKLLGMKVPPPPPIARPARRPATRRA